MTNIIKLVHVRLNHPHGLVFDLDNGRRVTLKGNAFWLRGQEKGVLPIGLYGKTTVDSTDWDEVLQKYGKMSHFHNGSLIWEGDAASADDHAEDNKEVRHGREPIDVKNDKTIRTEEVTEVS